MRAQARPPRRKWPWIVLAILLVGLIAYAIYAVSRTSGTEPTPRPTPTENTSEPSDALPSGCLAGNGLDATTLLRVQELAPHSASGAVEVAAGLMRWAYQYPYPSEGDAAVAAGSVISSEAPDSFRNLPAFFAAMPNLSGGIVADGVEYRLSTVTGVWLLERADPDAVTTSIGASFVTDGELSAELKASTTVTLRWEDGAWRADQLSATRTTEDLFAVGTPFEAGC